MSINDYYPETQVQTPDLLGQYLKGALAPGILQEQQQQLQRGGLELDQIRQAMAKQNFLNQAGEQMVTRGMQQTGQASPSVGRTGGIQNGPQDAIAGTATASQVPGNLGTSPQTQLGFSLLTGTYKAGETEKNIFENQKQQAQFAAKGPMDLADSVATNPNAAQMILNNPALQQQWVKLAPQLGLNPYKDLTDANAQAVARFGYNQIAGQVGADAKPMPVREQDVKGPLNSLYQRNPLDNSLKQIRGEDELNSVVGGDGKPTLVPRSQAAGMQPFNASIFGANNVSDQAIQFAADTYRTTGKMPGNLGRNPAMQAKILDRVAQDASASGDNAAAIAARTAARGANTQALGQMTKLEANTKSYYDTMDKNLTNLMDLQGKVDTSGSPLINKALRAWQQGVTGDPEVAKYVTYLNAVQGEYAKIKSGSLGNQAASDASRKEAAEVINKYMSAGGIAAVAEGMRGEGHNRLSAIGDEKQSLMGGLNAGAPGQPGSAPGQPNSTPQQAPASTNAQGWTLHKDAKGNMAYVSPDGKQFQEVR